MPASAVVAASTVATASVAAPALGDSIASGLWSFAGGVLAAFVAFGVAWYQQRAQSDRERLKMAADSAGSHMANVAFDKYVAFCESYVEGSDRALATITAHGPTEKVLADAYELACIRRKWALWIPADTDGKLQKFEKALREIGASAHYIEVTRADPKAAAREEMIDRMYRSFYAVVGLGEWKGEKVNDEAAHTSLILWLRRVLGTEQFDTLRKAVIARAVAEFSASQQ